MVHQSPFPIECTKTETKNEPTVKLGKTATGGKLFTVVCRFQHDSLQKELNAILGNFEVCDSNNCLHHLVCLHVHFFAGYLCEN